MHTLPLRIRRLTAAAIATAGLAGFSSQSDAALTIDLRLPNGEKCAISVRGEKYVLDVWATVTGSSTDLPNSYGLSSVHGSIVSQGGLDVNIRGRQGDVAQYKGGQRTTAVNPFAKSGEQPGNETDLDGDGDTDLGAPNQNGATGFFIVRADPQEYFGSPANTGVATPDGKGVAWRIGRIEATVAGNEDRAELVFLPRRNANGQIAPEAALWYDDDGGLSAKNAVTGALLAGDPFEFSLCPEPATATGAACLALGLLRRRRNSA
jgi:hypothetical protein